MPFPSGVRVHLSINPPPHEKGYGVSIRYWFFPVHSYFPSHKYNSSFSEFLVLFNAPFDVATSLINQSWAASTIPSLHLRHSSFSNPSVALPTSQIILQPLRCFTYVSAHSPPLLSLLLSHRLFTYLIWRATHATSTFNKRGFAHFHSYDLPANQKRG